MATPAIRAPVANANALATVQARNRVLGLMGAYCQGCPCGEASQWSCHRAEHLRPPSGPLRASLGRTWLRPNRYPLRSPAECRSGRHPRRRSASTRLTLASSLRGDLSNHAMVCGVRRLIGEHLPWDLLTESTVCADGRPANRSGAATWGRSALFPPSHGQRDRARAWYVRNYDLGRQRKGADDLSMSRMRPAGGTLGANAALGRRQPSPLWRLFPRLVGELDDLAVQLLPGTGSALSCGSDCHVP